MKKYIDKCIGYRRRCWNRILAQYNLEKQTNPDVKINKDLIARLKQNDGLQADWENEMPSFIWSECQNTLVSTLCRFGKANLKGKNCKQSFTMDYQRICNKNKGYFISRGKHQYFQFNMGLKCGIDRKLRWIKLTEDVKYFPEIGDVLCDVAITKEAGRYYASFNIAIGQLRIPTKATAKVGIDPGIHSLMTLSDGTKYNFDSKAKKKLARLDKKVRFYDRVMGKKRSLNKNWKHSKRYKKIKAKRARVCQKIKNIRKDAIQKMTTEIVSNNKYIYWEDVKSKNMVKNHKLAKAIYGACWGKIKTLLITKCHMHNAEFYKVPTSEASTQKCSKCGYHRTGVDKLNLNDRVFVCPICGHTEDRDVNAAKNISTSKAAVLVEAQPSK